MTSADQDIEIVVPSDVARLRHVIVGPVKPFTWESLRAESDPNDDPESSKELLRHNRVEIPEPGRAAEQHATFIGTLEAHGVEVSAVATRDDVAIQLYPRDIAFAVGPALFLARSRVAARRREQRGLDELRPRFSMVVPLNEGTIEGGDVVVTSSDVLVGLGEETTEAGAASLQRALETAGIDRRVVTLPFAQRGVVHLDTKFAMVGERLALWHPPAFTPESRKALEQRFELIEATAEETRNLELNVLAIDPATVIVHAGSERIAQLLRDHGVTTVPVDYSEVARFPGAFHCATLPLRRG